MKALSIKQPWATLIAHGIKDIENRTWRTKFRGRIYIHAPAKTAIYQFTDSQTDVLHSTPTIFRNNCDDHVFSAIIGEVDIVDCVLNHTSVWAEQMAYDVCPETGMHILRKGQPYVWNWVLANPLLYDKPIENVKGALSFWEYAKFKGVPSL
ncbi:ASCH domain-containing protein [Pedobacter antarcticus]|uniref:ASCH domain-containing protein n=1 Tax=Pedobacter antarcticus TaxID=34086 RepID=UPI00292F5D2B|nr:ASCH domain-containing protein [Pedobacter antarcticus]